jgi:nucleotide-binding universal stress UspA family protein
MNRALTEVLEPAPNGDRGVHGKMGRPDAEIVRLAEEIRAVLIVIGGRGFWAVRRALMGSVSDSIVRHAHCPALVVRDR